MKALLLPLLILLIGCEKKAPSPEITRPNHVEVHVQVIDAVVVLNADGQELVFDGRDAHGVTVYQLSSLDRLAVLWVLGNKATLSIHDYSRGLLLEIGEVKGGERYGF